MFVHYAAILLFFCYPCVRLDCVLPIIILKPMIREVYHRLTYCRSCIDKLRFADPLNSPLTRLRIKILQLIVQKFWCVPSPIPAISCPLIWKTRQFVFSNEFLCPATSSWFIWKITRILPSLFLNVCLSTICLFSCLHFSKYLRWPCITLICSFANNPRLEGPELLGLASYDTNCSWINGVRIS